MIRRYKLFNSPSLRYPRNWTRSGWVQSLCTWWRWRWWTRQYWHSFI